MRIALIGIILIALGGTSGANAQILDGGFEQGGSSWSWYRGDYVPGGNWWSDGCEDYLYPEQPQYNDHLTQPAGSTGWSARPHESFAVYDDDGRVFCGSVEQPIEVPTGHRLVVDYKIGREVSEFSYPYNKADLSVEIDNGSGAESVFSDSGKSTSLCSYDCPDWQTQEIDVSQFWGQDAILSFASSSTRTGDDISTVLPTKVWVDNVKFEPLETNNYAVPKTGNWYNPDRSGNGLEISKTSNGRYTLVWFTYRPNGDPVWYISDVAPIVDGVISAVLYKVTRNVSTGQTYNTIAGSIELQMLSNDDAVFSWDLNSASGNESEGGELVTHLHGGDSPGGMWYDPADSGWGTTLSVEGSGSSASSVATVYYYNGAEPVWAQGVSSGSPYGQLQFSLTTFIGTGLCPACLGQTPGTTAISSGTMTMQGLPSDAEGWVSISNALGHSWSRGSSSSPYSLSRLTFN